MQILATMSLQILLVILMVHLEHGRTAKLGMFQPSLKGDRNSGTDPTEFGSDDFEEAEKVTEKYHPKGHDPRESEVRRNESKTATSRETEGPFWPGHTY